MYLLCHHNNPPTAWPSHTTTTCRRCPTTPPTAGSLTALTAWCLRHRRRRLFRRSAPPTASAPRPATRASFRPAWPQGFLFRGSRREGRCMHPCPWPRTTMWRTTRRWPWSTRSSGRNSTRTEQRWSSPSPAGKYICFSAVQKLGFFLQMHFA